MRRPLQDWETRDVTVWRSADNVAEVRSGLHLLLLAPSSVSTLSRLGRHRRREVDRHILQMCMRPSDVSDLRSWWMKVSPYNSLHHLSNDDVLDGIAAAIASGGITALLLPNVEVSPLLVTGGGSSTANNARSGSAAVQSLDRYSPGQKMDVRLAIVVKRARDGHRLSANLKAALLQLISPQNIATIAASMAVLAAAQAMGVGEVVDVGLVAVAYISGGLAAIQGMLDLIRAAGLTLNAGSDSDLDRAADLLAQAIISLEISGVLALLGRAAGRRGGGREAEQSLNRPAKPRRESPPYGSTTRPAPPISKVPPSPKSSWINEGKQTKVLARENAAERIVLEKANFAQKSFKATFSEEGAFGGRRVNEVAADIRAGRISPSDIPLDYIVRDGNPIILNTRSAQALEQAGVPRGQWNGVNRTGDSFFEELLSGQLSRNKLGSQGTSIVRPGSGRP